MKKTPIILAALFTFAAHAQSIETRSDVAEVLEVLAYQQPGREICQNVQVQGSPVHPPQERSNSGAIIGGLAGALLGNTVGKGSGRIAATAIGAGTGAIVGDRLDNQSVSTPQVFQRQCIIQPGAITYTYKALVRRTGAIISGATPKHVYVGQLLRANTTSSTVLEE